MNRSQALNKVCLCGLIPVFFAAAAFAAEPPAQPGGWENLLEGNWLDAWVDESGKPIKSGWTVEDGVLHRSGKAGSLVTKKDYGDFELEFEWKVAKGSNSGVKYRLHRVAANRLIGPEYQILDDAGHRDGKNAKTSAAAIYQIKEPDSKKELKPVGEWNQAKIVARGTKIEHWLNGKKVLEVDTAGEDWPARLAASKFKRYDGFADWFARQPGPVMFQAHTGEVFYRNIRIRELKNGG
ncbi:MAG: DUF1080 domain-containing protein [Candidatus Sumerlaeia bacterium]|nr:DUF1080 domain-containing protein [Candidatus Sumerlaeia bacterium]